MESTKVFTMRYIIGNDNRLYSETTWFHGETETVCLETEGCADSVAFFKALGNGIRSGRIPTEETLFERRTKE